MIGFTALDAYLSSIADQFEVHSKKTTAPLDKRMERLFRKLSTEPLDHSTSVWKEFKLALELRDECKRPKGHSRIDINSTERALDCIWTLLNKLSTGIYGSRWA